MFDDGPPNTIISNPLDDRFRLDIAQLFQGHFLFQALDTVRWQKGKKKSIHLRYLPYRRHPSAHRTVDARACAFRRVVRIHRRPQCLLRHYQKKMAHGSGWQHACHAGFRAPCDRAVAFWPPLRVAPPRTWAQRFPRRSGQRWSTCRAAHFPHSRYDKYREQARFPKGTKKNRTPLCRVRRGLHLLRPRPPHQ